MGGIGKLARRVQIVGILLEEKGRLAVRILAHLTGMRGVVPAHAEDPAHGKAVVAALHGDAGLWWRYDWVFELLGGVA